MQLDDPTFAKLLDLALRQVTSPGGKPLSLQKFKGLDEKHSIIAKSTYASLVGFILEAAKTDSSGSALSAQLQEAGLGDARMKLVAKKYESNVEEIQKLLGSIGFKLPKIVGIDWRLDYTLRSSKVGKLNGDMYFIKLKTLSALGVPEDVEFTCNFEQLKDLLSKVRDAKKELNRVLKSSD